MAVLVPCETTDRSVVVGDEGTQVRTHYRNPAARSTVS